MNKISKFFYPSDKMYESRKNDAELIKKAFKAVKLIRKEDNQCMETYQKK